MSIIINRSQNQPLVDRTHLNPVIQAVTWILLAIMTMALIFRLLTRFYLREQRNFGCEDALSFCSYISGLGQSITMLHRGSAALGNISTEATPEALDSVLKTYYAYNMLFVAALGFAKLSVCASLFTLSPFHKWTTCSLGLATIVWALTSIFALAFQCSFPHPWDIFNRNCANRAAIARYVAITNIVTDLSLVLYPIAIVVPLQMPFRRRLAILSLFFARIITVAATAAQLAYISSPSRNDFTLAIFPYIICTQVVQCSSFSTACMAYFWPFLKSLQSGLIWADTTAPSIGGPSVHNSKCRSGALDSTSRKKDEDRRNYIEITLQNTVKK